jgi:hypothetical protein
MYWPYRSRPAAVFGAVLVSLITAAPSQAWDAPKVEEPDESLAVVDDADQQEEASLELIHKLSTAKPEVVSDRSSPLPAGLASSRRSAAQPTAYQEPEALAPGTGLPEGIGEPGDPYAEFVPMPMDQGDPLACVDCNVAPPFWAHRTGVFAEYLYLRPANVDVVYALQMTGPDPDEDSPTGPVGQVAFDAEPGIRGGFAWAMSDSSSLQASYTFFEANTSDSIEATGADVLQFQVSHPSVANAGATSISSQAAYDLEFQRIDLDYRRLLYGSCDSALNYSMGVRYASLEQQLLAQQSVGVSTGLTTVTTEIDFDGFGIGFGLDGQRRSQHSGLLVYGKGGASFLAGEFKADFRQVNQFGGAALIANDWTDQRLVSILEAELGVGWQNDCGDLRFTVGYNVSGWFNTLTTGQYIDGVQELEFDELEETLAFSGLTTRLDWRF